MAQQKQERYSSGRSDPDCRQDWLQGCGRRFLDGGNPGAAAVFGASPSPQPTPPTESGEWEPKASSLFRDRVSQRQPKALSPLPQAPLGVGRGQRSSPPTSPGFRGSPQTIHTAEFLHYRHCEHPRRPLPSREPGSPTATFPPSNRAPVLHATRNRHRWQPHHRRNAKPPDSTPLRNSGAAPNGNAINRSDDAALHSAPVPRHCARRAWRTRAGGGSPRS